jgi:hypothetical protein
LGVFILRTGTVAGSKVAGVHAVVASFLLYIGRGRKTRSMHNIRERNKHMHARGMYAGFCCGAVGSTLRLILPLNKQFGLRERQDVFVLI